MIGYTDRQQETQRESEGEVKEKGREAGMEGEGGGEAHSCTFIEPKISDGVEGK